MSNLYNINKKLYDTLTNYLELDEDFLVNENTGEVVEHESYDLMLAKIGLEKDEKIKNILLYIVSINAEIKELSSRKQLIDKKKSIRSNQVERLKNYLLDNMQQGDKHDYSEISVSVVKGLERIEIAPDAEIPKDYLKVEYKPMRTEIKKALKDGLRIQGVNIVRDNKRLIIK